MCCSFLVLSWGPTPTTCAFATFGRSAMFAAPICFERRQELSQPHDLRLRGLWPLGDVRGADSACRNHCQSGKSVAAERWRVAVRELVV